MNKSTLTKPCRLAFRSEGEWVVCYLAGMESMEDASELARVRRVLLDASQPDGFDIYRAMMETGFAALSRNVLGAEPSHYEVEPAPEHERSSRA